MLSNLVCAVMGYEWVHMHMCVFFIWAQVITLRERADQKCMKVTNGKAFQLCSG